MDSLLDSSFAFRSLYSRESSCRSLVPLSLDTIGYLTGNM